MKEGIKNFGRLVPQCRSLSTIITFAFIVTFDEPFSRSDDVPGYKAEISKGVQNYRIRRHDIQLKEHGVAFITLVGYKTRAAFRSSPDHAAVASDFTMLEDEVVPVIKARVECGIEAVVHNHMVCEQPRIFFLH